VKARLKKKEAEKRQAQGEELAVRRTVSIMEGMIPLG
jgi:hypothetical protein